MCASPKIVQKEENIVMAMISCPECGKQISDRAFSCPNCGCPINAVPAGNTQESAAKEVEKLLVLARRAREGSDGKNAKKYYDQILDKDPGNWEAIFYSVYFEASECKIRDIGSAANSVANCINSTFAAIADLQDEEEQDKALDTVISSALVIATMFVSAAVNHYNQFSTTNNAFGECSSRVVCAKNIYQEIEDGYKKIFPDRKKRLADHQKIYISFLTSNSRWFNNTFLGNMYTRLGTEIKTVYPEFQTPAAPVASAGAAAGRRGCRGPQDAVEPGADIPQQSRFVIAAADGEFIAALMHDPQASFCSAFSVSSGFSSTFVVVK